MSSPFEYFSKWLKDTMRYYKTLEELSQLTDRELSDIGLNRYDIAMVAAEQYGLNLINTEVNND